MIRALRCLVIFAAVLCANLANAGPVEDGFAHWEAGEQDAARAVWEEAADTATPSGVLLYNLGVAWYRAEDYPRAVAYWRAARRLRPRDARLTHNLARGRAALEGAGNPVAMAWGWMELATVGEVGLLGLLLLFIGGLRVALRPRAPNPAPWWITWAVGLFVLGLATSGMHAVSTAPVLVVVDAPAVVRGDARVDAEERFVLQPGAEVRAEHRLGDFVLVRSGDDRRGWIPVGAALGVGPGAVRYSADRN